MLYKKSKAAIQKLPHIMCVYYSIVEISTYAT